MSPLVPAALFTWPAVALALFVVMPARRATLVSVIGGTLFLPVAGYSLPGIPDYSKQVATAFGAMIGVAVCDSGRLLAFRPRWFDVPMAVFCVVPMASSISNGLGAYDGLASVFSQSMEWGVPYILGRLYLSDLLGMRELATAIVLGGLIYVPLCLIEVRLSPQLHNWVYGFHQHQFAQTKRLGGFRPTVFMSHGLMVSLWMSAASLLAVWLWMAKARRTVVRVPMNAISGVLIATAILCKSVGALALLAAGLGTAILVRTMRTRALVLVLLLAPPMYIALRATGIWSGRHLVELVEVIGLDVAAGSLNFRLQNENILAEHALKRPLLGWGGWARNRPGGDIGIVTDGLWIIALGKYGFVGLSSVMLAILLPAVIAVRRVQPRLWLRPEIAPMTGVALVLVIVMIDNLFNALVNPVYMMAAGGVAGCAASGCCGVTRCEPRLNAAVQRAARHMGEDHA